MLKAFFEENPKLALAFSGGVDSAYLLYAAKTFGADVKAYYVKTPFQPEFEYEDALQLAENLGAEMVTISLDILSAELGLSVSYISRFFSSKLKMSFSDYINGMRLSEAVTLLNDSKLTITNISSITGFPSIRTFNNAFMKQYGMTPSQYRNLERNTRIEVIKNP